MTLFRDRSGPRIKHVVDEGAYETITVDKLTPVIGGEIGSVDLSKDLSNRQMDEIHRALAENLVVFFRDQHLSQDQHLDFGRRFGELHIHPAAPAEPGHPELMKSTSADKDSPRANGEGWHSGRVVRPRAADGQHRPAAKTCRCCAAATPCSPTCTPRTKRCPTG